MTLLRNIINALFNKPLLSKQFLLFCIVPVLFVTVVYFLHLSIGNFHQLSIDPEYALLYNGIVVGTGTFAINFIDHPATPLIFIIGFAARAYHLLFAELPYLHDFLNNPETYIKAANFLNVLLIAFTLSFSAIKIHKYSKSLLLAIGFQLALFANHTTVGISSRLIPEASMIIPLALIATLTIKYIYSSKENVLKKYLWQFPLIIAFGVGCKLSFAPMLLFPFILLKTNLREKLRLVLYSFLFCAIFAYPILTNFKTSFQWFTSIVSHSGMHGSGESAFINWEVIPLNCKLLFQLDPVFWGLLFFNIILVTINFFTPPLSTFGKRVRRAQISIIITILIISALTIKHFAYHYFMPFLFLKIFLVLLAAFSIKEIITNKLNCNLNKTIPPLTFTIASIFVFFEGNSIHQTYNQNINRRTTLEQSHREIKNKITDRNAAILVDAPYWGGPFEAYAHAFGFMKTHKRKTYYKTALKEKYDNFFWFIGWDDNFNHWDNFVGFSHIFNKTNSLYIYSYHPENYKLIKEKLNQFTSNNYEVKSTILYQNNDSTEKLIYILLE